MRDVIAGAFALLLLLVAIVLGGTLHLHRRRRLIARRDAEAHGRRVIAELPAGEDLLLFTEDDRAFHLGERRIPKEAIGAVRVLINGSELASFVSPRDVGSSAGGPSPRTTSFHDPPEGIARDRWDVAIETADGSVLVECGAIRERVSQELARKIFDAVKAAIRI